MRGIPTGGHRVVIAAAWLPDPAGSRRWRDGTRNAAAAMRALAAVQRGAWVAPTVEPMLARSRDGIVLEPVAVDPSVMDDFADGQCAGTFGPLYLDAGTVATFRREWRDAYREVNRAVAAAIARRAARGAAVWVHDLPLQLVPGYLRDLRPDLRIGWYLDAPFPDPDRLAAEPMHDEIAASLLVADVIGFQQHRDALNFAALADTYQPYGPVPAIGVYRAQADVADVEMLARTPAVIRAAAGIRAGMGDPTAVLLSVAPPEQNSASCQVLDAYTELLAEGRIDPATTSLMHVSLCQDDPTHARCDREGLDRRIAQINGVHGTLGRPAVHYIHRELRPTDMVAFYLVADVLLALPLREGMNVTAKEYVIARPAGSGRIVLSEFSGAATELIEADTVNPNDIDAVKVAIERAVRCARVPDAGMARMRHRVTRHDAHEWASAFLGTICQAATNRSSLAVLRKKPTAPTPWASPLGHLPQHPRGVDEDLATEGLPSPSPCRL